MCYEHAVLAIPNNCLDDNYCLLVWNLVPIHNLLCIFLLC